MNVYVAGRTSDQKRVNRVQQLVRDAGHTITYDWTADQSLIRKDWADHPITANRRATEEVNAVIDSHALVLCWTDGAVGALFETGVAMGHGVEIIVLNPTRESVFFYLPGVFKVEKETEILDILKKFHT